MTGLSNRGFYSSRKDTQRVSIRLDTRRLVLNFVREQALRYSLGVTPFILFEQPHQVFFIIKRNIPGNFLNRFI